MGDEERMSNVDLSVERIGTISKNKYGSIMFVEKYNGSDDIWVKFEQGNLVHAAWNDFLKGKVRNVYDKSVYGIGYLGEGSYKTNMTDINGKHKQTPQYKTWHGMMKRCYNEKYLKKFPTYVECIVCEEWLNFQNFAKWYDQNYYTIEGQKMELDKDILMKGNKVYSPETCIFVPKSINYLFIKCNARRGDTPIGMYYNKEINKYTANCSNGQMKTINLGSYNTVEQAFKAYKEFKEKLIKQTAEDYEGKIPSKLYEAMLNYQVGIDD